MKERDHETPRLESIVPQIPGKSDIANEGSMPVKSIERDHESAWLDCSVGQPQMKFPNWNAGRCGERYCSSHIWERAFDRVLRG